MKIVPEISIMDEKKGHELITLGSNTASDKFYWEALETFKRAIHSNPYNMSAWSGIAEVLNALERYEDALQVCEKILQIPTETPRYWDTYHIKANALEKLGKIEDAKQLREKVRQIEVERKEANEYWLWTKSSN